MIRSLTVTALLAVMLSGAGVAPGAATYRASAQPGQDPPVQVRGHDGSDSFVGTGAVVGGAAPTGSGEAAGCSSDCTWLLEPVCMIDDMGTPPTPGQQNCAAVPSSCPEGEQYLRVWTQQGGAWSAGDTLCSGAPPGVTVADLAAMVGDRVRYRVPALRSSHQPDGRALVNVAVLFDSGQSGGTQSWTDTLGGLTVTTRVTPAWIWRFGDGHELRTSHAGSVWPDTEVSHPYRTPGRYRADVTVQWPGDFTVAGLGTFPIAGAVTQRESVTVAVTTAGAVLVPNP